MTERDIVERLLAKIRAAQQEIVIGTGGSLWLVRPLTDDEHQYLIDLLTRNAEDRP